MVLVAVIVGGCSASGLPNGTHDDSTVARGPQCLWHFTAPGDTSDSDETTGVATCDAARLILDDGIISIEVHADGTVFSSKCQSMTGKPLADVDRGWFVDVDGCGTQGLVGVNLR
jgi:hypothetical protein